MKSLEELKVAIVADSLDQYGGAEKIVDVLCEIFPNAPIYTSFYNKEKLTKQGFNDSKKTIITPFFGTNKFLMRFAKPLFFIYPYIFEHFDFTNYDLVISSSSRFAHSVITSSSTIHVCYMHSPSRYAWDYFEYINNRTINHIYKGILSFMISYLRVWDRVASDRVDYFISNSTYTKKRIKKFYRRESKLIYPFVNISRFTNLDSSDKYFLYLGRITPWKKIELLIDTYNKSGFSLRIVGNGETKYVKTLKAMAHPNIEFFEHQTDDEVVNHLSDAKALLWVSIEDFGIVPIEAQAAGKPVIAYRKGGVIDSIIEDKTGIFFDEQSIKGLTDAINKFNSMKFERSVIKANAKEFSKEKFIREFKKYILEITNETGFNS